LCTLGVLDFSVMAVCQFCLKKTCIFGASSGATCLAIAHTGCAVSVLCLGESVRRERRGWTQCGY
jgi:hypothetical protein